MTYFNLILVDDDPDEHFFFTDAIKSIPHKFNFNFFYSGQTLFEGLKENVPNVIFLDINLPSENGFEILKALKGNKNYSNIPVIIYSTSRRMEDIDNAYRLGADLYFPKEDSVQKLSTKLERILNSLFKGVPLNKDVLTG